MTRWLAGSFDPQRPMDSSRLATALAPSTASIVDQGPLHLAYTGPAIAPDGPLCVFDGFLDNSSDLGEALEVSPDAPCERLLLAGYRRWGGDLPGRMRGDFVLLIWDQERGEGFIARDQLGVRGLYLHDSSGGLSFASEIRFLLAMLPTRPGPDPVTVAHWLTMGRRPGTATLYEGIRRLDPGAMLLLNRDGVREEHYWALRFSEPIQQSESQISQEVRTALDLSIQRRIAPEGLTGVVMSGGLDSASVAAVAATQAPGQVSAYSAIFPEHPGVDESELIGELRGTLGLGGINAEVRAGGMLESALEATAEWQLPLLSWGDFWALPLLRAAAAEGVRVTLGGDGGDELFGARAYVLADRLRAGHPFQSVALARELPGSGDHPGRRHLAKMLTEFAVLGALPYGLHKLAQKPFAPALPGWLRPQTVRDRRDSEDPLAWKRMDGPRWWAEIAHGLTRGMEEIGVLEHQRRRAVTAGLAARHPLFDLDLVELCLAQPPSASFDRYRNRPVLRAAMSGLLPDPVRLRPQKALFDSVLIDCLDGPDGEIARVLLSDSNAELRAYVDTSEMRQALFDSGQFRSEQPFQWMWQVWRLFTAECWLRAQANPGIPVLPEGLKASSASVALRQTQSTSVGAD